ncbi:SubName: Full=Uncharacterized protein {ECO:0000313/EMBL:CCA76439.1} [Serendipita indica DSM 11827]|uniref:Uncharacterized protein n=1 Tax=Serendipita indica (strain DSM 11827) TaxID=1109443 RepID=G4TYP6_SERID|nr:SubName: Full=Uncharacterized protein {ECO:0000313/EMBL:CCA76439.1} [Serendipita indica DSM 11827]CCA76439.1 hypothetical protein PIIN_10432 [Serendipita indica DSM 11827]
MKHIWAAAFVSPNILLCLIEEPNSADVYLQITDQSTLSPLAQRILLEPNRMAHSFISFSSRVVPKVPRLEVDSPNLPHDLPISPYITDEEANWTIRVDVPGPFAFFLIRTHAICRQFEARASQHASRTYDYREDSFRDIIIRFSDLGVDHLQGGDDDDARAPHLALFPANPEYPAVDSMLSELNAIMDDF